jgi:hypothetical protein
LQARSRQFHTRTDMSLDPVERKSLLGEKATEVTASVCPSRTAQSALSPSGQTAAVLSADPDAMITYDRLSGAVTASASTGPEWKL